MQSTNESLRDRPYQPTRTNVYYSVAAQEDNLGDIVIRRTVLRWIEESGCSVHVFCGAMPKAYVDALLLPVGVTPHYSHLSFTGAWVRSSIRRQVALVYAPGPRVAMSTLASTKSAAVMLAMTGITRSAGGQVLGVSGALRGTRSLALTLHRMSASISTDYSVRDEVSSRFLETRSRLVPDVGFADSRPSDTMPNDPLLVMSMRFDRAHDAVATHALVREANKAGLRPVLLTQVRRDQENHREMADHLGIDLCGWTDQSHTEQLERIDGAYRNAAVVVSDRLHACIFGARHGAVIVNAETPVSKKLASTLSTVYPTGAVSSLRHSGAILGDLQARREEQAALTRRATADLDRERLRLKDALSHAAADRGAHFVTLGDR